MGGPVGREKLGLMPVANASAFPDFLQFDGFLIQWEARRVDNSASIPAILRRGISVGLGLLVQLVAFLAPGARQFLGQ